MTLHYLKTKVQTPWKYSQPFLQSNSASLLCLHQPNWSSTIPEISQVFSWLVLDPTVQEIPKCSYPRSGFLDTTLPSLLQSGLSHCGSIQATLVRGNHYLLQNSKGPTAWTTPMTSNVFFSILLCVCPIRYHCIKHS